MKKKILLIFVVIILSITGCSNGSKEPSEDLIKSDLESSLTKYKDFLTLSDYKVDKSKTENNTFTATIDVTANGQYATHKLSSNVVYTKYDQGWQMDKCTWKERDCEINNYPSSDEIMNWINYSDKGVIIKEIDGDNGVLNITRAIETIVANYIHILDEEIETYNYNSEIGIWEYEKTENNGRTITIDKELEGTYYSIEKGTIAQISDVSEDSFRFAIKGIEQNNWEYNDIFKAEGWDSNEFRFENSTDSKQKVSFTSQLTYDGQTYYNVCIEYKIFSYPPFMSDRSYILIE